MCSDDGGIDCGFFYKEQADDDERQESAGCVVLTVPPDPDRGGA
jgi:hypothetical protein